MDAGELGRRGESVAARYYLRQGCRLLAHNYRTRMGELDLILASPDRTIILCEVKTRSPGALSSPASAVDGAKQRRLILAAQQYLQSAGLSDADIRFDVAEVIPLGQGRWSVHVIKGAFVCESGAEGPF